MALFSFPPLTLDPPPARELTSFHTYMQDHSIDSMQQERDELVASIRAARQAVGHAAGIAEKACNAFRELDVRLQDGLASLNPRP